MEQTRSSQNQELATRVVVVAANSIIVEAVRAGLRRSADMMLVGTAEGRTLEAEKILAAKPDALLLDDMEEGAQTLALIRELRVRGDRLSIVVLTFEVEPSKLQHLFDAGADAIISKEAHPASLVTLLRAGLNGHVFVPAGGPRNPHLRRRTDLPSGVHSLSDRELEILLLAAAGASNGEIARQLWVTEQTVKFHLRNIYRKLKVTNRTQAGHYAHVNGLVRSSPPAEAVQAAL